MDNKHDVVLVCLITLKEILALTASFRRLSENQLLLRLEQGDGARRTNQPKCHIRMAYLSILIM